MRRRLVTNDLAQVIEASWAAHHAPVGVKWGQRAHIGLRPRSSNAHEFRVSGQVGQESHLQPAVLETVALCFDPRSGEVVNLDLRRYARHGII